MTPQERGFHLAAINGFSCSTHYAYELGAEMVLLERNNDHIGDIQTGVAFVRGAAANTAAPGASISLCGAKQRPAARDMKSSPAGRRATTNGTFSSPTCRARA